VTFPPSPSRTTKFAIHFAVSKSCWPSAKASRARDEMRQEQRTLVLSNSFARLSLLSLVSCLLPLRVLWSTKERGCSPV